MSVKTYRVFFAAARAFPPLFIPMVPVWVDADLDRGPGDLVGQDGATTNHMPLANFPAIFTTIISLPSYFTKSRRHSKPYEMLRPVGNTYNQGFDFIESGNAIYYGYPAEVQVKPFGFVILGWLSICLLPAVLIHVLEAGVKTLAYYTALACNKLFGTRQQPFDNPGLNPGFLAITAATVLAHVGWTLISIPTSVVTLTVRLCEQGKKGVVGLMSTISSWTSSVRTGSGLTNCAPSRQSPTHTSEMPVNVERQSLVQRKKAQRDNVSQSVNAGQDLSQRDTLQDSNHLNIVKVN